MQKYGNEGCWKQGIFTRRQSLIKALNLSQQIIPMTQIVIDKKKYVLVPQKEFEALQKKAALKTKPEKLLSIASARAYSKNLIRKWAAEK